MFFINLVRSMSNCYSKNVIQTFVPSCCHSITMGFSDSKTNTVVPVFYNLLIDLFAVTMCYGVEKLHLVLE